VLGSNPQSGEDGLLQVREIRDVSLNASLVTLSACDTGVGPLEGEEGIATSSVCSCLQARSQWWRASGLRMILPLAP
jgi:CHAT domain